MQGQNEVGGRTYPPEIEEFIYALAIAMRNRDKTFALGEMPPSFYMKFYIKAAAIVVESAARLSEHCPLSKTLNDWVKVITGLHIKIQSNANLLEEVKKLPPRNIAIR